MGYTCQKNLLYTYGFGYAWLSQDVGDIKIFLYNFKQRVTDIKSQDLAQISK